MNVHIIDRMRTVPGYRGMVQPIEEAAGPLLLLRDLIEEEPLEKVLWLLDLGLALYAAGDTLFVIRGDLLIHGEMLESIMNHTDDDDDNADLSDKVNAVNMVEKPVAVAA